MPLFTAKALLNQDGKGLSLHLQYQLHHFRLLFVHSTIPIYLYVSSPSLPIASHMAPHSRLCSLTRNTPQASAPHFLRGALFHLQDAPERDEKGHPRQTYVFYSLFLPLSVWLRCQLHPHESILCLMLANHFILHAKSLARLALRAPLPQRLAFVPTLLRYIIHA